jgi:hypothetical protein
MSGKPLSSAAARAESRGLAGFARSLRGAWPWFLLRLVVALVAASLAWTLVAPVYAGGLGLICRALAPRLEQSPDTRYVFENGRLLAQRLTWLPKQQRLSTLNWPIWQSAANYGVPLLAALILATPGWGWRRRARALGIGLGLLTLTQIAFVLVTVVASQYSPAMSPEGMLAGPAVSPMKQRVFYGLYYFFDLMGRGFFALAIYLGLIALGWGTPESTPRSARPPAGATRPSARRRKGRR